MGGHAFKNLYCPRMPPDTYNKVKAIATVALNTVFSHVTVPLEIPGKIDHGDCDFLVAEPFGDASELTIDTFRFEPVVNALKYALGTPYGRRGYLTRDCLYFAIPMPFSSASERLDDSEASDEEQQPWVQIDVKVCFKPESFSWTSFGINYASQSGILGSMVKPLGLTLDPEGLHVRLQEVEGTDWAGSMVLVTKDPWTACKLLGLSRKAVDGGFKTANERKTTHTLTNTVYEEYAGSWLFRAGTFKAKLEDESYLVQHTHRSYFLKKWILERFPDYKAKTDDIKEEELGVWTTRTRAAVREKIFTMFPHVAERYFVKRSHHVNEVEERRLRGVITAAIPYDNNGWCDDFDLPHIITRQPVAQDSPGLPQIQPAVTQHGELTPPPSPPTKTGDTTNPIPPLAIVLPSPLKTILYTDALPRQPPFICKPSPPPKSMSAAARLACLARWTAFSEIGTPYLLASAHAKSFDLQWRDALEAGCKEEDLVKWAEEMWWVVWVRQCVVNWRGMWAKRFEKEDAKADKMRKEVIEKEKMRDEKAEQEKAENETRVGDEEAVQRFREKMRMRLDGLNRALGLLRAKE